MVEAAFWQWFGVMSTPARRHPSPPAVTTDTPVRKLEIDEFFAQLSDAQERTLRELATLDDAEVVPPPRGERG